MAIIPQYDAGPVAEARAPVLGNNVRSARVDNSAPLAALGRLAENLQNAVAETPNLPSDFGQGGLRGVEVLGEGVQEMGSILTRLRTEKGKAQTYNDIHEHKLETERLADRFKIYKEENPNPSQWESRLAEEMTRFRDSYLDGKEVSPEAKEQIERQFESFRTEMEIKTGLDAVRATTAKAREANKADIARAVEAKNLPLVMELTQFGYESDWYGEDTMVDMQLAAQDEIEANEIKTGMIEVNTHIMNKDIEAARATLERMPLDPAEKKFELTRIDQEVATVIKTEELVDRSYDDPLEVAKELEAKGKDGNFLNHQELPRETRDKLISNGYKMHNAERAEALKATVEGIDSGALNTKDKILQSLWGANATDKELQLLIERMDGVMVDDAIEAGKIQTEVSNYDPAKDGDGEVKKDSLITKIRTEIKNRETQESLIAELEDRANGKPMTLAEKSRSELRQSLLEIAEAKRTYLIQASEVEEHEGQFGVYDPKAPNSNQITDDDPNWFKVETWRGTYDVYRRVLLSQRDRNLIRSGNVKGKEVEDILTKNREMDAFQPILETLDLMNETGEITTVKEHQDVTKNLLRNFQIENAKEQQRRAEALKAGEDPYSFKNNQPTYGEGETPSLNSELFPPSRELIDWTKTVKIPE